MPAFNRGRVSHTKNDKLYDLNFNDIIHETEAAVLFQFDPDDSEGVWLPKSRIEYDENTKVVTVPSYLVEQKDLEDYVI